MILKVKTSKIEMEFGLNSDKQGFYWDSSNNSHIANFIMSVLGKVEEVHNKMPSEI